MSVKGVEYTIKESRDLSQEQAEVLRMLIKDFDTPRAISIRRKTTVSATYKTISKLRKKGYLSRGYIRGLKKRTPTPTIQPPKKRNIQPPTKELRNGVRLHAQEFNIKIIHKSDFYKKLQDKNNLIFVDDNTIRLYKDSIEVYTSEHKSFLGEDEQRATALSFSYWRGIFSRLESRLRIVIVKGEHTKIRQVNAHYSEINNELAEDCIKKKVKVRVFANEDGKLWFSIDDSFNLSEAETLHPSTSKRDMSRVKPFFNDLRDNDLPTLSDIMKLIKETAEQNKDTSAGLNVVTVYLRSRLKKVDEESPGGFERPGYIG